ncbi:PREDICTED: uncharacterized protein LOC104744248 [Camelina sativa]|uniref:Uncharacterized protein LOC104744248 n=1 Tax=Camelina sativa TaxID=90675 RepID=A0ABM0VZF5_CAMSA|nr:PREDICTED: uncharacterized protein LOC104744248 [Camelina sativa]
MFCFEFNNADKLRILRSQIAPFQSNRVRLKTLFLSAQSSFLKGKSKERTVDYHRVEAQRLILQQKSFQAEAVFTEPSGDDESLQNENVNQVNGNPNACWNV